MQWTDRIRQVKILLVAAAVLIAVASLIVSHFLTRDLSKEERARMEVWAQAMKSLSQADENTDLSLVLRVLNDNNTIPVVVTDRDGVVTDFRNVRVSGKDYADSLRYLTHMAERLQASGRCIRISLSEQVKSDYMNVCYDDSLMLKRLAWYPFIQLGVVMIFVVVAIFALLTSKRAEQNKVWVGLSKETAHQLGTPISSLMAWQEILKELPRRPARGRDGQGRGATAAHRRPILQDRIAPRARALQPQRRHRPRHRLHGPKDLAQGKHGQGAAQGGHRRQPQRIAL